MITEVADFLVRPEDTQAFDQALVHAAASVLCKASGYRSHRILNSQETPGRVLLLIEWDSLESHTVDFRQSPAFTEWRAIIGPFFVQPPRVEHFDAVV